MKVEQGALGVAAPLVEWRIETSILFAALDYLSAGDADILVLVRLLARHVGDAATGEVRRQGEGELGGVTLRHRMAINL